MTDGMTKPPFSTEPGTLKVLDVAGYVAGPFVATLLADMGAEVIKVERPGKGDPLRQVGPVGEGEDSLSYPWLVDGRNKRSVTLDFRDPRGREVLLQLIGWADIMVENYRPGVMAGYGLAYDDVATVNPRLVYVSVSGFGQDGPYRDRPGFDYIASAFGGLTWSTGYADRPPVLTGFAMADYLGGTFGALGALEAIRRRDAAGSDGEGEWVNLALYEPILRFSTPMITAYEAQGYVRQREGAMPVEPYPDEPRTIGYSYQTLDHCWLAVAPVQFETKSQQRYLNAIERPDLLTDPSYATGGASPDGARTHYLELDQILRDWIGNKNLQDVIDILADARIPCAPVNGPREISNDPHLRERNLVQVPDNRGMPITMQAPVPTFTRLPNTIRWAGETLGASNQDVYLGLLNMTPDEYEELTHAGVI